MWGKETQTKHIMYSNLTLEFITAYIVNYNMWPNKKYVILKKNTHSNLESFQMPEKKPL